MNEQLNHRENTGYILRLFNELLSNRETYFNGDILNSEGRKLLEIIIRELVNKYSFLRRNIYVIRRRPYYENIVKIYNVFSELVNSD